MPKNIAFAGVGLFLLASPLLVAAQTTTASNTSLIATLTALVQTLEAELQALIAGHSSTTPTQQTTVATGSANCVIGVNCQKSAALSGAGPNITPCAAYANLAKGDTDATTGGEVTQLQQFVGISPTTGYYGAQTSIAYQNKCANLGNAQPTSVPGMSEYTDSSFGFSFWYPSGWTVSDVTGQSSLANVGYNGPTGNKVLRVSDGSLVGYNIYLYEYHSPNGSITDYPGPTAGNDPVVYFFSSSQGAWMTITGSGEGLAGSPGANNAIATITNNTMGGLHLLSGGLGHGEDVIIPLSADNFVIAVDGSGIGSNINDAEMPLANTIVTTNPAVAIPVSTAQQTATIQAEASAYGVSSASNTSTRFFASPTSGAAPLTVTFSNLPTTAAEVDLSFGDGPGNGQGDASDGETGNWPSNGVVHTYTQPGTYTATVVGEMSEGTLGTVTITVLPATH